MPREGVLHNQQDDIREFSNAGVYHGGGECKIRDIILSKVIDQFKDDRADVIETSISPFADRLPQDFAGMSGGGVWQIRVKIGNDGHCIIDNIRLAGVGTVLTADFAI
ncbi:MAG: hypothetical protein LLF94_02735 [Chlamydiales bacterium]|nr:hypothetical protein [Chlamydiales bacterium]